MRLLAFDFECEFVVIYTRLLQVTLLYRGFCPFEHYVFRECYRTHDGMSILPSYPRGDVRV